MSWTVRARYSNLPGEKDQHLVALDVVDGSRVICGVQIRPDHDEAWHLKQAHRIAAVNELHDALEDALGWIDPDDTRLVNRDECKATDDRCKAALAKAEGR